jgi:hypothetical protein
MTSRCCGSWVDSCSWAVVVGRRGPTGPHPSLRLRGRSCRRQRPRDVELDTARPDLRLTRTHARADFDASDPDRLASLLEAVKATRHRRCAGWHGATGHEQRDQDPQYADLQPACGRSTTARRPITGFSPVSLRHASDRLGGPVADERPEQSQRAACLSRCVIKGIWFLHGLPSAAALGGLRNGGPTTSAQTSQDGRLPKSCHGDLFRRCTLAAIVAR